MRSYRSRRRRVIDAMESEVCNCKDQATARRVAEALNLNLAPGGLFIPPALLAGATLEWPDVSLLDDSPSMSDQDPRGLGERFGFTDEQMSLELEASRRLGFARLVCYVPTRAEVRQWSLAALRITVDRLLWEAPAAFTLSNEQVTELISELSLRPDAETGSVQALIDECRYYLANGATIRGCFQ